MSDALGVLTIKLEADIAKFESDFGRAQRVAAKEMEKMRRDIAAQVEKVEAQFQNMSAAVGGAIKGLFAGASVGAFAGFQKHLIDTADDVNDLSKTFGISTRELSIWRLAAEKSGTGLDGIAKGARALTKDLDGSEAKLKTMGIALRDQAGNVRPLETVMEEVATKFAGYKDGAEKAALATALFGKSGTELIPFLNDFGANVEENKKRAEDFGVVIGAGLASAADEFNDNARDMKAATEGFGLSVLNVVLPPLNDFIGAQVEATRAGGGFVKQGEQVGEAVKKVAFGVVFAKNVFDDFGAGIIFVGKTIVTTFETAAAQIGAFGTFSAKAFDLITDVTRNPVDRLKELGQAQSEFWTKVKASAADGRASLTESWTELKTSITGNNADITAAWRTFVENGQKASDAIDKIGKSAGRTAPRVVDMNKAMAEFNKLLAESRKMDAQHDAELMKDEEALVKLHEATIAYNKSVRETTEKLRDDIEIAGLSGEAREKLERHIRAETMARKEWEESLKTEHPLSEQAREDRAREIEGLLGSAAAVEKLRAEQDELINTEKTFISSVAGAFGELVASGFKKWKGFLDSMKQALKQWVAQVISIMTQRALLNAFGFGGAGGSGGLIQSLVGAFVGGGGGGGVAGGGTAGGQLINAGTSLVTGGQGGGLFGGGSPLTTQIGGTYIMPYAAAAGGAFYGYNRAQGGAASIGAGLSYGALGYAAGTVALGAGLGAAGGAAVGAAASGAGLGAMGAAAAIPIVGWVLAALAVVDLVSGGKLFGTKFKPKNFQQGFNIGESGGSAFLNVNETRQRALFGGTARRTRSLDPGKEATAQAAELFDSIKKAADEVGDLFGVAGKVVAGSFTRVLDKKGKNVKDEFSTVFGKQYKESAEAFATRMVAEAQIATVDAWLASFQHATPVDVGQVPTTPIGGIPGRGGGGGRGGDSGEVTPVVKSAMDTATFVSNEASQIAERWRSNAEKLAEGAQFLVLAAVDMKHGQQLLGDDSTLTAVTNIIEDLQKSGEKLAETYQRVKAETELLDQALKLSHVDLGKTREEIVRFADDIATAAGGLQQAQSLWESYFEVFYSADERAKVMLDEAQKQRDAALESIGLDTNISIEQFRKQFETALPNLSPEDIVKWLEAGKALGNFTRQLDQFNQSIGNAAAQARDAFRAEEQLRYARQEELFKLLDDAKIQDWLAGLDDFQRQLAEIHQQFQELRQRAIALGASTEQLAVIDGLEQRAIERATRAHDADTDSLNRNTEAIGAHQQAVNNWWNNLIEHQRQMLADLKQAAKGIADFLNSQPFGISTASPEAMLRIARQQFEDLARRAAAGDVDAINQLQAASQQLLQQGSSFYGRGSIEFAALEAFVRNVLGPIAGAAGSTSLPDALNRLNVILQILADALNRQGAPAPGATSNATVVARIDSLITAVKDSSTGMKSAISNAIASVAYQKRTV